MTEETRTSKLAAAVDQITRLGGLAERTRIDTNLEVIDATGGIAGAAYIIIEDQEGYNVPAVRLSGVPYTNGDLVNVLYVEGTEPVAFQQGSGSVNPEQGKVSKIWQPDFSDVVGEANNSDLDFLLHGNLDFDNDGADHSITAAGTSDLLFTTAGGTITFDDSGNLSIPGDLTISGATKKIVGAGSNVPDIGSTTAAEQFGNIYLASGKDIYPGADEAGLFQRNVNMFQSSLTTHFDTFTGWTWAAYTGFTTPGNVDTSTPSVLLLQTTATEGVSRSFAYRSSYAATITARLSTTLDCRTGLRMDDGTNNNYIEWFAEPQSDGTVIFKYRYSVGGSVTGPSNAFSGTKFLAEFISLQIRRSGDLVLLYYSTNIPSFKYAGVVATITGWTPARSGIYHEHTAASYNLDRVSLFDWYKQ